MEFKAMGQDATHYAGRGPRAQMWVAKHLENRDAEPAKETERKWLEGRQKPECGAATAAKRGCIF